MKEYVEAVQRFDHLSVPSQYVAIGNRLNMALNSGRDLLDALALLNHYFSLRNRTRSPRKLAALLQAGAWIGVMLENWKLALLWQNRHLNLIQKEHAPENWSIGQMVFLLIHWELGNFDVIESRIRAIKRVFSPDSMPWYVQLISQLFSDLINFPSTQMVRASFQKIFKEFEAQQNLSEPKRNSGLDIILAWLTAKTQAIKVDEVVQKWRRDNLAQGESEDALDRIFHLNFDRWPLEDTDL